MTKQLLALADDRRQTGRQRTVPTRRLLCKHAVVRMQDGVVSRPSPPVEKRKWLATVGLAYVDGTAFLAKNRRRAAPEIAAEAAAMSDDDGADVASDSEL